ncbi:unnamed protein product, partial [Didymodactylos carnosus]
GNIDVENLKSLSAHELNEILEYWPKVNELPEEIQTNTIYRLSLNQETYANQATETFTSATSTSITTPPVLQPVTTTTSAPTTQTANDLYKEMKDKFVKQHLDDVFNLFLCATKKQFNDKYMIKKQ